jgi:hypothetical protein
VTISGFVYWLETLAPYAQAGYIAGALYPEAVYLTNGTDVVRVARGGWIAPNLTTSTESDEGSSRPRMADRHGETLIPGAELGPHRRTDRRYRSRVLRTSTAMTVLDLRRFDRLS